VDAELSLVDVTELAFVEGEGAIWSLPHGGDLDANVVRVGAGHAIDEHINDEVDVLVAIWSGAGDLTIDGRSITLAPGVVVGIPRGRSRAVYAGSSDLVYLSVHRRREPLTIRTHR
jgi:quercetin dioxygenase-like cupin family protein